MSKPVIGLTGPTGAGKSTLAAAWRELGCMIIDADRIAREVVSFPECLSHLKAEFGGDIVNENGSLNRKLLGQRAFSDPDKTARLNAITHPSILREISDQIIRGKQSEVKAVIVDAPLLFESNADRFCDVSVAVTAPEELRLSRIMSRDGISRELASERIAAQHDEAYFLARARYTFPGLLSADAVPAAARALLLKIFGDLHETF